MDSSIVEISATRTHELRRLVLRTGTTSTNVVFDGDDELTTSHLGALRDNAVVAIATLVQRSWPAAPGRTAIQLRGMATHPDVRGEGVGQQLLDACREHARAGGANLIWARARTTALGFYLHAGFAADGSEFIDEATGLAHVNIVQELD